MTHDPTERAGPNDSFKYTVDFTGNSSSLVLLPFLQNKRMDGSVRCAIEHTRKPKWTLGSEDRQSFRSGVQSLIIVLGIR